MRVISSPLFKRRTLRKAEAVLELVLASVKDAAILWPSAEEQNIWSACVQIRNPIITKNFDIIDGKTTQW